MTMAEKKEELLTLIHSVAQTEINEIPNSTPFGVIVPSNKLRVITEMLQTHPSAYFDMLTCVTGVDNGPEADTMEVLYHLYSIPFNQSIVLKVILDRKKPEVESLVSIWKSANWLEREVYDMFGIVFHHHPDLRRILMPADWKGFPLRKDDQHEEYYRGIKIDY